MLTRSSSLNAFGAYLLLLLSLACTVIGGYEGMNSPGILAFCTSTAGWLVMLVTINVIPLVARWASKKDPLVGMAALAVDGAVSGIALTPLLHMASVRAPGAIGMALAITAAVFLAITLAVLMSPPGRFSVPAGALGGIGLSLLVAVLLNGLLLHLSPLRFVVCIGVGIYGALVLAFATEEIVEKRAEPVEGALLLFAALFNIFVSVLNLLLSRSPSKN